MKENITGKTVTEDTESVRNEIVNILVWSFFYSQGSLALQDPILRCISKSNPEIASSVTELDLKNSDEFKAELRARLLKTVKKYENISSKNSRREHHYNDHVLIGIADEINTLLPRHLEALAYGGKQDSNLKNEITKALTLMLERDINFMTTRAKQAESMVTLITPKSHFVAYILDGKTPPGGAHFRKLFQDFRVYLKSKDLDPELQKKVDNLIEAYNRLVPDDIHEKI